MKRKRFVKLLMTEGFSRFEEDLEIVKQYEPQLYKAAIAIFGKSYEYTRAYRKFRDAFKRAKRKGGEGQTWIDGV